MIDRTTVDRIYAAANIVEVVGDFITLKKKGINYQACCPFHNEKTPSFVVSAQKGLFKCFGCGKGGNAVSFVMEHEGMTYVEALKYVARKYGIEVQEREMSPEEQQRNDDRESMMVVSSFAEDYFRKSLHDTPEGRNVGLAYFRERGVAEAMVEKFRLGYCPSAGDEFSNAAVKEGYREEFLVRTGLTIKRENGTYYDRFTGRVMFPIHSISGRVIAFGGRTLRTDKKTAKYLNSPESEIYHKSDVLYGLFFAKKAISQEDFCILVEGYTDVISLHQSGIENVVASSGTSLTQGQVKLISRFTKNVTVIYDGDPAGIKASLRGIDIILAEGMNVRIVLLPEGEDPDSFARARTSSELREYILDKQQDFLTFKAGLLLEEAKNDPIRRAAVIGDMVESISVIPDAIARNVYIKDCSRSMQIDEEVLVNEVRRKRRDAAYTVGERDILRRQERIRNASRPSSQEGLAVPAAGSPELGLRELEKELVTYLLRYGCKEVEFGKDDTRHTLTVARAIIGELAPDNLEPTDPVYGAIYREYLAIHNENPDHTPDTFPMNRFTDHLDPKVCNAVVDILMRGETLKASKLWEKNEIVVENEEDRLFDAVPRAVILYKSKILGRMVEELIRELDGMEMGEKAVGIIKKIGRLNEMRLQISARFSRIIL